MKDLVIAIYRRDCYAGETILKLEKVLVDEKIPEIYNSCDYELKPMSLVDFGTDPVQVFAEKLKEHYPKSPSVCNTIDRVADELKKGGYKNV